MKFIIGTIVFIVISVYLLSKLADKIFNICNILKDKKHE